MKVRRFKIPIYDYSVVLAELESKDDSEELKKVLNWINAGKEDTEEMVAGLRNGLHDGGYTYCDLRKKKFLILLFPFTSPPERMNTLGHEKRHMEDRIMEHCRVDDIEAAGYLAGFLTKKLFI